MKTMLMMATTAAAGLVPTGATIEKSGYATVLSVPSAPPPPKAAAGPQPTNEAGWYARSNNISNAEAAKRMAEQRATFPAFARLQALLRQREKGNFTDVRMIHQPQWAYVFYFKRKPAETLARYSKSPHFKAALASYTRDELDAIVKPWAERFTKAGIIGGYGTDATYGTADFMMSVTEEEYRAIAAKAGWGALPAAIKLEFAGGVNAAAVDPRVAPLIRGFASEERATTIQLTALGTGRIVLKDGCLRLGTGTGPLVVFHRETGVGLDVAGYVALIDRMTGKPSGRVGEMFAWAGPNGDADKVPGISELRARCGAGPAVNLGNPESKAWFDAKYSR